MPVLAMLSEGCRRRGERQSVVLENQLAGQLKPSNLMLSCASLHRKSQTLRICSVEATSYTSDQEARQSTWETHDWGSWRTPANFNEPRPRIVISFCGPASGSSPTTTYMYVQTVQRAVRPLQNIRFVANSWRRVWSKITAGASLHAFLARSQRCGYHTIVAVSDEEGILVFR